MTRPQQGWTLPLHPCSFCIGVEASLGNGAGDQWVKNSPKLQVLEGMTSSSLRESGLSALLEIKNQKENNALGAG